jgi:hypothetical protein
MFDASCTIRRFGLGSVLVFSAFLAWTSYATSCASAQASEPPLVKAGKLSVAGREVPYRIRNLPISSFPDLPGPIAEALNDRGCLIPQTYEAKRPENVIHGSLERAGSQDWAVLCAAKDKVSLLVFFASSSPAHPEMLAAANETDHLQIHDLTGELGFNWGIDPASPTRIHDAEAGMTHRPPLPDHDCLADTILERRTVYHLYRNGAWEKVDIQSSSF